MVHNEDIQFIQRISVIESSLLDFYPSRVDEFYQQYNEYTSALERAIRDNVLKPSTTALAIALSVKVYHTIESSLEVERLSKKLMGSFLDETAAILDCSTKDILPSSSHISEPTLAPYIKPSYEWLVTNIHNPYPSPDIRDTIARKSGVARKDVDNWFMDARKRIGWNDARKTHFSNKRTDIIDVATRFYANDEKLSLSQGAEHALISIMKTAKDLYCDKFNQTTLASELDAAVKDLTPQTKAEVKAERLRQLQMKKARDPYPSPERSPEPEHSPPTPRDDDMDNTSTQCISITNRKRQNPVELVDVDQAGDARPIKRARLDESFSSSSPNIISLSTGLPSPVSSIHESLPVVEPANLSSPSQPVPVVSSRKRRSSETDIQCVPKRPRNPPHGPRLKTVSDSSFMSSALFDTYSTPFDGWFNQTFDLPNVFDGDDLTGFDFELGTFPNVDCGFDLPAGSDGEQASELSESNVLTESQLTTSTNDFSFEELQSLWSNASSPVNTEQVPIVSGDTLPPLPSPDFDFFDLISGFDSSTSVIDSTMKPYSSSTPEFLWGFPDIPISLTCDRTFGMTAGNPLLVPGGCSDAESLTAIIATPSYYEDRRTRLPKQAAVRVEKIMQLLKMKEDALKLELELATNT